MLNIKQITKRFDDSFVDPWEWPKQYLTQPPSLIKDISINLSHMKHLQDSSEPNIWFIVQGRV